MDPYIILEHNGVKYRTVTKKDAGKNPQWTSEEASYELKITSSEDTITFSAFDEDFFYDDFIGSSPPLKMMQI